MRVGRQDHPGIGLAAGHERPLQVEQQPVDRVDAVADVEFQVGGDLVVAAAAGVQLATDVTEPLDQCTLDVHVHVFQLGTEREVTGGDFGKDRVEFGDDRVTFLVVEQADLGQHPRMGLRTTDVDGGQAMVKTDRFGEGFNARVRLAAEASAPGFISHPLISPLDTASRHGLSTRPLDTAPLDSRAIRTALGGARANNPL